MQKKIYISPKRYNAIYIRDTDNNLALYNEFVSIGKNYSNYGEDK